jgi:HK97 family phage prohead protease
MAIEPRKFTSEIRAAQSQGDEFVLFGRAVSYNTLSAPMPNLNMGVLFREKVVKGAFTKSLAADDQTADWNHKEDILPLGRKSAGTLNLQDKEDGLYFRITLDPNQQLHRELHSAVKRGDVKSCSWAFAPDEGGEDWSEDPENRGQCIRTIKSCKLFAVTVCNSPAYPGDATSVAARSAAQNVNRNQKSYQEQEVARTGIDKALETLRGLRYAAEVRAEEAREKLIKSTQALDAALRNKAEEQRASFGFEVASDGGGAADPEMKFRCKSASTSSSAAEHRLAAKIHRCRRDKAKTADDYAWDDSAAQDHDAAADGDVESQRRVVKRCNRDYKSWLK